MRTSIEPATQAQLEALIAGDPASEERRGLWVAKGCVRRP